MRDGNLELEPSPKGEVLFLTISFTVNGRREDKIDILLQKFVTNFFSLSVDNLITKNYLH